MKTKKLLGIFFLFLCTITLVSCGDDEKQEIYSLSFEKGYYERPCWEQKYPRQRW